MEFPLMPAPSYLLLSAARKYCIDQHAHWCQVYEPISEKHGVNYTDEAYDTFPRYHTLDAILNEIEKIDGENYPFSLAKLKEQICDAGNSASSIFLQPPLNTIEASAISDEREKFVRHIQGLTEKTMTALEPLPYRRVLNADEVRELWQVLKKTWGCNHGNYFYPLNDKTEPSLVAFDMSDFFEQFTEAKLQEILQFLGIDRLYELREYNEKYIKEVLYGYSGNYLLSAKLWEPFYDGYEGFWTSGTYDWIMYASENGSITVGGILKDAIVKNWPEYGEFEWHAGQ